MFHIIPHRAVEEPKARVTGVDERPDGTTASLRVEGLLCSACAANVRRRLKRLEGVRKARVDLASGEAQVAYDPARVQPDALVAAIEGAVLFPKARRLLAGLRGRRAS